MKRKLTIHVFNERSCRFKRILGPRSGAWGMEKEEKGGSVDALKKWAGCHLR